MPSRALSLIGFFFFTAVSVPAQSPPDVGTPEIFRAKAHVENSSGTVIESPIQVHVLRYTPDFDRTAVETGLKLNGYQGFVTALRKAPDVGYVELNGQKTTIRWARETPAGTGRTIIVITERPVLFLGGGRGEPKPRAGYEVALVQLQVDAAGLGTGTMAAAARIKLGGESGIQIDDYAEVPITLLTVRREPG